MTGDDAGLGVDVQGVADHAAPVRIAREHRDLSVGRHLAAGDLPDDIVDLFKRIFQCCSPVSFLTIYSILQNKAGNKRVILTGTGVLI